MFESTVMLVKAVQPKKAVSPIEVTELGIVTLVKAAQPEKAPRLMEVMPFSIVTDFIEDE